jgi:hypothetical protein
MQTNIYVDPQGDAKIRKVAKALNKFSSTPYMGRSQLIAAILSERHTLYGAGKSYASHVPHCVWRWHDGN